MKTPYQLLNITADSSDAEIKQAYLQKVKENPPDHNQETFQQIHNAYNTIKNESCRIKHELFTLPPTNFDLLIKQALSTEHPLQLNTEHLTKLLQVSIDETSFINAFNKAEK